MTQYFVTLNFRKSNLIEISIPYVAFGNTYEEAIESIRLLAQDRINKMGGEIISIY